MSNYLVRELEGLAIIERIKSYHPYLVNSHFTVVTDHMALKYLMNVKADTGRIARWALALQGYDFTVVHRKGLVNRNADALSRHMNRKKKLKWYQKYPHTLSF